MKASEKAKEKTTRLTSVRLPVSLYNNLKGGNLSQKIVKALETSISNDVNANQKRFTSITNIKTLTEFDSMKWSDIVKRIGFRGICELCNMDWSLIDMFIREHNPNNYRRVRVELMAFYMGLRLGLETKK